MSENILYAEVRDRGHQDILIQIGKKIIAARLESCDNMGILVVFKKDKQKVVNSYKKREKKTFIPWHRIKCIDIP
ncbi:MAG: hypothetical protein WC788_03235 [Candidatus Paceibacterota bacterium]